MITTKQISFIWRDNIMFIRIKSYYLKPGFDIKVLKRYGFNKYGTRDISGDKWLKYYEDTRRFAIIDCPRKETRARIVKRYIKDLIKVGLVAVKPTWEWIAIVGRWQDYSDEKLAKIEAKLKKLQEKENEKWKLKNASY